MTDIRPQLRAMPSSLNDACRTMEVAAEQIDGLVKALTEIAKRSEEFGFDACERATRALAAVGISGGQGERS